MPTADTNPTRGEPDTTAAELALGLLEGEERAAALRRLVADPAFAREAEQWRDHFAVLSDAASEIAPSDSLADRVMAKLEVQGFSATVATPTIPAAWRWKAFAIGASAIAATLAGILILRPAGLPPTASAVVPAAVMVAALQTPDGKQALLVAYDARHRLRVDGALLVPAAHSAELWVIDGTAPPKSLGVLRSAAADRMDLPAAPRALMPVGATLAISLEPAGGSPTGLPTGPIVASGILRQL